MKTRLFMTLTLALLSSLIVNISTSFAQGTAFTYQGRLTHQGAPANGSYDLHFALFDAPAGGGQIGGAFTTNAVAVSNGLFTVTLDFGAGVFLAGAERWLILSVRTNGEATFTPLTPPQHITAAPYAIMAGNLSCALPSANLSGAYGNVLKLSNPANQFSGSGAGLSAVQSTNVINSQYVINVRDFGAVPTPDGSVDSTAAIQAAIKAQAVLRYPLYFPCPSNCYYKVSGSFIYDGRAWCNPSFGCFDTDSRVEIEGDWNTIIVQTSDQPVFVFTNGINAISIQDLKLTRPFTCNSSTSGGIAIYADKSSGENLDVATLRHVSVNNFKYGLYSESGCVMNLSSCSLINNQIGFCLINTNATGNNNTGNNSILIQSCDLTGSWQAGYICGGAGVVIDSCEGGASTQTNFLTLDSDSGLSIMLRGGNVELHHGAGINIIGSNPSSIVINEDHWGLGDYSGPEGAWNIYSTNILAGPRVTIDNSASGAGTLRNWDCAVNHFFEILQGSVLVQGSNRYSGAFTNRLSRGNQIMAADGINYGGPAASPLSEGYWTTKYGFDAKNRTALSFCAVSNWGVNQGYFWRNVLQYNFDKEDGLLVNTAIANRFTASNYFSGSLVFDGTLGNQPIYLCNGIQGPLFRSADPALSVWSQIGAYNYTQDDFGIYRGTARDTAPTIPFFWSDLANNRTSIGHAANSKPGGTATLNVEGTTTISGLATATNGFASWRSNGLPSVTIKTTGYTNNILSPACNVNVYLTGTGLTVIKNTKPLSASLTGTMTVCLKPNEYLTTIGTLSSMEVEPE